MFVCIGMTGRVVGIVIIEEMGEEGRGRGRSDFLMHFSVAFWLGYTIIGSGVLGTLLLCMR